MLRTQCGRNIVLFLFALLAFAALLYRIPQTYSSLSWGLNALASLHWAMHLPFFQKTALAAWLYRPLFLGLLLLLWATYGSAVFFAWRGGGLPFRPLLCVAAATALLFAVLCPPTFATDVYAYVGYARLFALYGQNPYVCPPQYLVNVGDPVRFFLYWNLPTVYGPVWTLLSAGIVAALHNCGLWGQVLALKVVEAAALLLTALAGRSVAERLSPGRGNLAFLAIALNPFLLIEGPGCGHNDLLLMGLLLSAAACQLRGRSGLAGLLLGLSIGVKLVTIAVLPWLIWQCCRGRQGRDRLRLAAGMALAALLPTVLGYLAFWHGAATFSSLLSRSQLSASPASVARDHQAALWLLRHGVEPSATPLLAGIGRQWPVILLYT